MIKIGRVYFVLFTFFVLSNQAAGVVPSSAPLDSPYQPGNLLVRIKPGFSFEQTAQKLGSGIQAKAVDSYSLLPGLYLYKFDESRNIDEVLAYFSSKPEVEYAEPNFYYYTMNTPNDPSFSKQWSFENTGQTGGKNDADINALKMWEIEKGSKKIAIGIIDSGVDYTHPDLVNNMWNNPGEIPNNQIDDDKNGYRDDVYGANTIQNNGNPMDDNRHGTHVAGTIGAQGNNEVGVVGVAQEVQIAACKFLNSSGSGTLSNALKCLQYFADLKSRSENPINLVATNNSWGGGSYSQSLFDAIKRHEELGILFIAAAGNSSKDNDSNDSYPANYGLPNVVSVAATDSSDKLADFSNYGKRTVHVGAPGVKVLSTTPNNRYQELSGTSMAAPHVTGLAAIIASHFPDYNYRNIKNLLMTSGQSIASLSGKTIAGKRIRGSDINGVGALTCQNQALKKRLQPDEGQLLVKLNTPIVLSALHLNCADFGGPFSVYSDEFESIILEDQGANGDLAAQDGIYSIEWTPSRAGVYELNFGEETLIINVENPAHEQKYAIKNDVAYRYEQIGGLRLNVQDDSVVHIISPFAVLFGNNHGSYKDLFISSNGVISLTGPDYLGHLNEPLPYPNNAILLAPLWDDLVPRSPAADVYVDIVGNSPSRKLVIEWRDMSHYRSSGSSTFQVVLHEDNPDVLFNYLDTNFTHPSYNYGANATVGIQPNGHEALQVGFNSAVAGSLTSLLFRME